MTGGCPSSLSPPTGIPAWLAPLVDALPTLRRQDLSPFQPPASGGRPAAVLVLFGQAEAGPDLLLIERAATLRSHAGQPAFPGGARDPGDADLAGTALREASEEVGLDPRAVTVVGELPPLWLPPSGFVVTAVLAWWHQPHPVYPADPGEVAAVVRVPLAELVEPDNRFQVVHPSGWVGPAFEVRGMTVWGFTAGLLDRLLTLGGWERPWDTTRQRPLPGPAAAPADLTP